MLPFSFFSYPVINYVSFFTFFIKPAFAESRDSIQKSKRVGEASADATADIVFKDNGSIQIELRLTTAKRGISGVADGGAAFSLIDTKGKELMTITCADSVGATLRGYEEKKDNKNMTIIRELANKVSGYTLIVSVGDTNLIKEIERKSKEIISDLTKNAFKTAGLASILSIGLGQQINIPIPPNIKGTEGVLKRVR